MRFLEHILILEHTVHMYVNKHNVLLNILGYTTCILWVVHIL